MKNTNDEKNWILTSEAKEFFSNAHETAKAAGCSVSLIRQAHYIKNPTFIKNLRKGIAKRTKLLNEINKRIQKGGSG